MSENVKQTTILGVECQCNKGSPPFSDEAQPSISCDVSANRSNAWLRRAAKLAHEPACAICVFALQKPCGNRYKSAIKNQESLFLSGAAVRWTKTFIPT